MRRRGGGLSKGVGRRTANQPSICMLMAPPSSGWLGGGLGSATEDADGGGAEIDARH